MELTAGEAELKAVAEAIHEHHALVYRLAHRLLRNPADAEDVTQSVFLLLLRSHASYASARSAKAWLARVTVNQAISWVRAEKRRRQRERSWATATNQAKSTDDMSHETTSPERLHEAVQSLPDQLRVPLILHYQEGFKYREIAEACKCPEGTVARRISIAKERLRRRLVQSGAALTAWTSLEGALRAQSGAAAPSGLAERLIENAARELARVGGAAASVGASHALTTTSSTALLVKLSMAFGCAFILMSGIWYGLEKAMGPDRDAAIAAAGAGSRRGGDADASSRRAVASRPASGRSSVPPPAGQEAKPGDAAEDDAPAAEPGTRKGPRIHGQVRDAAGKPIAGARVAFAGAPEEPAIGAAATTDAEGLYALDWDASIPALADLAVGATGGGSVQAGLELLGEAQQVEAIAMEKALAAERYARAQHDLLRAAEELPEGAGTTVGEDASDLASALEAVQLERDARAVQLARAREQYEVVVRRTALAELAGSGLRRQRPAGELRCSSCHADPVAIDAAASGGGRVSDASASPPCAARGRDVIVRVVGDGFAPGASEPIDLQETEPVRMDFVLAPARALSGMVLTPRGEPLAGVEVAVVAHGGAQRLPPESLVTHTDDAGAFAFASLPRGAYLLRAVADGCLPAEGVVEAGSEGCVLRAAPAAALEVTVVDRDAGQPLAGYRVELHDALGVAASSTTDEEGKTMLGGLVGGRYLVNTFREDSSSQYSRAAAETRVLPGEAAIARLVVEGRADIAGVVRGLGGATASGGFVVQVVPLAELRRSNTERKESKVAADGAFSIANVPPGRYSLVLGRKLAGGELEGLAVRELEVAPGQKQVAVDMALEPEEPATLEVAIVDDGGRAVAGASVSVEWDGLGIRAALKPGTTNAEGKVELRTRAAACTLTAGAAGFEAATLKGIALRPGERRAVAVTLAAPGEEAAAAPRLADVFPAGDTVTLEQPASLRGLNELLRKLRIASVALAPELEAQGVCARVLVGEPGSSSAHAMLEKALQSAGLTWRPAGGGVLIELPR